MRPSGVRSLILGLAVWLGVLTGAMAVEPAIPAVATGGDVARQVLVMLRVPPEHFQPDSDYGGGYGEGASHSARRRLAGRLAHQHGLVLVGDWPMPLVGLDCFIMDVPADQSPDAAAAALSHEPDVAWSEPMRLYHGQGAPAVLPMVPNDPLYRVQPAASEWRLSALHQMATGRDVRVAVVDSMVEVDHPDLIGQIAISENFVVGRPAVAERHGTGVAGIIAAKAGNGVGIVGIAPRARLLALRACWQQPLAAGGVTTLCDSLSLAKALHFAVTHDAQVINMSLSGPDDPLLDLLVDAALKRGITVVGAYDHAQPTGGFPAEHPGVVAVSDESLGAPPPGAFAAPGADIPTTQPGGRWFLVNGSSFSAAHVSGLFALLRELAPHARTGAALVSLSSAGTIDACASLVRASPAPCGCACAESRQYSSIARP